MILAKYFCRCGRRVGNCSVRHGVSYIWAVLRCRCPPGCHRCQVSSRLSPAFVNPSTATLFPKRKNTNSRRRCRKEEAINDGLGRRLRRNEGKWNTKRSRQVGEQAHESKNQEERKSDRRHNRGLHTGFRERKCGWQPAASNSNGLLRLSRKGDPTTSRRPQRPSARPPSRTRRGQAPKNSGGWWWLPRFNWPDVVGGTGPRHCTSSVPPLSCFQPPVTVARFSSCFPAISPCAG